MLRPTVDSTAVKRLVTELKAIDPDLAKQLGKDLKNELQPIAGRIQLSMPAVAPLSGMRNEGRLGFEPMRVRASATPGAGWGRAFAKFTLAGRAEANAALIEWAGRRSNGKTAQGRALIQNLGALPVTGGTKTGRYFFEGYRRNKNASLSAVQRILDRFVGLTNRKFN